ncbi:MAG: M4 family metallopeptidase [Saprospiraceae bacterium]
MKAISKSQILTGAFWLALLLAPLVSPAQTRLGDIAQRDAESGWIYFNPGVRMAPGAFFSTFQAELGVSSADHFKRVRSWTDDIGMTHHLFHQYHDGVRVENAAMLLHERDGELSTANGYLAAGIKVDGQPSVSVDFARQKSLQEVGAQAYAWENEILEAQLRADTQSPDTSWYPEPELLYVRVDRSKQFSAENMALAYRTFIHSIEPYNLTDVYVDAHSGQVLYRQSRIIECVPGTGVTNYYGTRNINVEPALPTGYQLFDDCRGQGIRTNQRFSATNFLPVISTSTAFPVNSENQNTGHWCSEMTYDYFLNAHGRNSFNGGGAIMAIGVGGFGANAFWTGSYVEILDGDNGGLSHSLAALDVVGHEWTHAVNDYEANLTYLYESGALEESFADIFGTCVEYYPPGPAGQPGYYGDYFCADDCWVPGGMVRNMQDPKIKAQPDTYLKPPWYVGSGDYGGVHTNSGVQNHWFYLLAEGSSATDGVNDIPCAFTVSGIGRGKAAAIAYRNLTTYLTPTSNHYDARTGSIQAAKDLYGANSNEVCQVANAWFAVGVGKDNLMMKDNLADTGAEPSNGINIFLSHDIWVRKTPAFFNSSTGQYTPDQDEDLMATFGGTNPSYVYVRIRNTGNVASQCGTLKMYWTRASTGLTWPLNWTNSFPCPGFGVCGDQFTACGGTTPVDFPIPSIAAGGDFTQPIIWCPPDPTLLPGTGNPTDDSHFCLLARIERENDPMHDEQINVSCHYNTWQNNNIAWQNITVKPSNGIYLAPQNLDWMCVRSRRVVNNSQAIKFRIQDDDQNPFLPKGDILVHLPDSLFTLWVLGGKQGTGIEQIGGGQVLKLIEPTAFLDGINMQMGKDYSICLAFNPFQGQPIDVPGNYLATIAQMEKDTDAGQHQVVGGEGFELRVNPYPVWVGNDVTICLGDSIVLTADLNNWNQNDSTFVYWDSGQTGASIVVAPNMTQTYTVNVTNGDGFIVSDQVTVLVLSPIAWYLDADDDGFGSDQLTFACQPPAGYADNALDCNDNNNGIHPGSTEICNGADDNCNGQIDEGLSLVQSWMDNDADGFGDPATEVNACVVPLGHVFNNTDCNDQNPAVHPNATEICNGIDDNCNALIDDNCVPVSTIFLGTAQLRILPNPNSGNFNVELPSPATPGLAFRIVGLTGQVVREQPTQTAIRLQTLHMGDLPSGLYFLQVVSEGRVLAVEKVVKQ